MTDVMGDDNRPILQSIAFAPGAIQVCFLERRDSEGPSTLEKTLTIPPELLPDDLTADLLDAIHQWLDEALRVHGRSSIEQFRGRR